MMVSKNRKKDQLISRLTLLIFSTVFGSYLFLAGFIVLLWRLEGYEIHSDGGPALPIFFSLPVTIFLCLMIVLVFAIYVSKRFLKPIAVLQRGMNEVKEGNFNIRIDNVYEDETKDLIDNFNLMVGELRKSETLKSDFISGVSHEFKTPLSSIQGYASLLQDDTLSIEDRQKYTKYIIDATQKLNKLVTNILKISKIDNQNIIIEPKVFSLDEQIRECILSMEQLWEEKNIELDINLDEIEIKTDKELLSNVWNNLIGNAIKYSNQNSKIEIKSIVNEKEIKISIKDYGVGIKKENIPYIFNKFYQGDLSHASEGYGLGLSLVKGILDLINAKIEVQSEENIGSEFIVTFYKNKM